MGEISMLLKLHICQECSHEFVELSECMGIYAAFDPH